MEMPRLVATLSQYALDTSATWVAVKTAANNTGTANTPVIITGGAVGSGVGLAVGLLVGVFVWPAGVGPVGWLVIGWTVVGWAVG